jgi:hypothetical protein
MTPDINTNAVVIGMEDTVTAAVLIIMLFAGFVLLGRSL